MNIIGICGRAGAGKDAVAEVLVKEFGFVRVGLADPLKRICRDVFDFTEDQLWGPSENRNAPDPRYPRRVIEYDRESYPGGPLVSTRTEHLTPRYALQTLGTEWARNCYENVWVDYALRVAAKLLHELCYYDVRGPSWRPDVPFDRSPRRYSGVAISDCRYPNEFEAIKAASGRVWRIDRPISNDAADEAFRKHLSETALNDFDADRFDCVINNAGTLEGLSIAVRECYRNPRIGHHTVLA